VVWGSGVGFERLPLTLYSVGLGFGGYSWGAGCKVQILSDTRVFPN